MWGLGVTALLALRPPVQVVLSQFFDFMSVLRKRAPIASNTLVDEASQHTDLLKVGDHPPHLQALRSAARRHVKNARINLWFGVHQLMVWGSVWLQRHEIIATVSTPAPSRRTILDRVLRVVGSQSGT